MQDVISTDVTQMMTTLRKNEAEIIMDTSGAIRGRNSEEKRLLWHCPSDCILIDIIEAKVGKADDFKNNKNSPLAMAAETPEPLEVNIVHK